VLLPEPFLISLEATDEGFSLSGVKTSLVPLLIFLVSEVDWPLTRGFASTVLPMVSEGKSFSFVEFDLTNPVEDVFPGSVLTIFGGVTGPLGDDFTEPVVLGP
jgi:hypothetical protein